MNPHNDNEMVDTLPTDPLVRQPHPVNQVTTVSKYLALGLFVLLPFLGGYVGYEFALNAHINGKSDIISMSSSEVVNEPTLQSESLYYFTSYDDVAKYISSTTDPHIDWKSKANNKLKVVEDVIFEDPNLLSQNEQFSLYFLLSTSTPDELVFSRGSLIKGGEPIGVFKLTRSNNTLVEIKDNQTNQNMLFDNPEFDFSFMYPSSWKSITVNSEEGSCTDGTQDCKFYTFAPSNNPARIFLTAQTQSKPLSSRGAFWGDFMDSSPSAESVDLCRVNDVCAVVTNSYNLNFTKQTNVHSCEEGAGCEGEGDYYQLFHPGADLIKFSLATYRLPDEDKEKFEDVVVDSFTFKK